MSLCFGQVHDGEAYRGERGGGGHGAEAAASPPGHQASTAPRQGPARVSQRDTCPKISVADPDPPDPHVVGPPGSGSEFISQRYGSGSGSGSGSFYHHAK